MYILSVIPLKKGIAKEHLSYFSAEQVPLGTIVSVPVRAKTIQALVIEQREATDIKSDIKQASYQLKKITSVKGPSPFSSDFFEACVRTKEYTATHIGDVISALVPKIFLEQAKTETKKEPEPEQSNIENIKQEKLIFQALLDDRLSWYRTLIREVFAKKQSIFVCLPTRYDIDIFATALGKGIEQYTFTFHSDLSKKKLLDSYKRIQEEEHPILIIGTGGFLSIARHDIKTFIVERESSEAYKQFSRPHLDIRTFTEILTSIRGDKLIFGDTLLRPETLYRHDQGELGDVSSPLFRLPQTERQLLVDMKEEQDARGGRSFNILSEKTKAMIEYATSHKESVFLYTLRKGLAGVTVCHDCGHTLLCPECKTPIVLYGSKQRTATKTDQSRVFMCNKCGHRENTEVRCPHCSSWNLTPIGIGTDRVYDEVTKLFPDAKIFQLDKEHASTPLQAEHLLSDFEKHPGSILIGTELALTHLRRPVTHSAIISIDGLLSIPNFNMTQKILHTIEKLQAITTRNLILQTRTPENDILKSILEGNVLPLYRKDITERKHFGYPPFKRLIKITFAGTRAETEKARAYIDHICNTYDPQIFSAFVGKIRGQYITNTVIKINTDEWQIPVSPQSRIDRDLSYKLSVLPPSFTVIVDPEDLL